MTPVAIHRGMAHDSFAVVAVTPGAARSAGTHQTRRPGRERPPKPRAWYGLGAECVFTTRPPPSGVTPCPWIPWREGHREPPRAGRINAAGWPDHAGQRGSARRSGGAAGQPAGSTARSPSRSFRINAQRRSCFRWTDDAPHDVEIVDLSLGGERDMNAKNGKRPAHPGEVLREKAEIAEQVTPRHAVVWRRR